jgi:hypothetical protein
VFGLDQRMRATWDSRRGRPLLVPRAPCGRLSLESGNARPTADQTGKTTVYWEPSDGNCAEFYDTTANQWVPRAGAQASVAVPSTRFRPFDLFLYWDGAAFALEAVNWTTDTKSISGATAATPCVITSTGHGLSTGNFVGIYDITGTIGTDTNNGLNGKTFKVTVLSANTFELEGSNTGGLAYTSGGSWVKITNTRDTALTTQNNRRVKTGDASRLYVGSCMTTGTSGETEDSTSRRLLWNYYHRRPRKLKATDTTNSWTYTTASWREANGRHTNRVEFLLGLDEDAVEAEVVGYAASALTLSGAVGVGLDAGGTNSADLYGVPMAATGDQGQAKYAAHPGLGYHSLRWLEYGNGSDSEFYGDAGTTYIQTGLLAKVWC